jgi:tetratricopeptide (TPR) repeat protein
VINRHLSKAIGRSHRALAGLALLLAACQPQAASKADSASDPAAATAEQPMTPSALGHYLAARQAEADHANATAADLLSVTLASDPDNPELLNEAFLLLAAEGKLGEAAKLADRIDKIDPSSPTAGMVLAANDMAAGDFKAADARLAKLPDEGVNRLVVPMARAWLALADKRIDDAFASLEKLGAIPGLEPMVELHAGAIADLAGRTDRAEAEFGKLLETESTTLRVVEIVGNYYQRHGQADAARKLYDKFKVDNADSLVLEPAIAALDAGTVPPPVIADPRDGLAETFFNLGSVLSREQVADTAMVFARIALALKPDFPIGQTLLAEMLSGQNRTADAIAVYRSIRKDSPFSWSARIEEARGLDDLGKTDGAIAVLSAMVDERKDRSDAATALGNVLRSHERFADAVKAYDVAIERVAKPQPQHWSLFYFRGIALERSKQWPLAEADLQHALELEPEQPYVMNYLAYTWVDQGEHLDEALKMLQRAVELKPDDGFIVDSLGWVYFRLGQYDKAVAKLERAVELEPADATITDHLGDAYWKAGRTNEARYQWRRALLFKPEPDRVAPIEAKLDHGLVNGS